MSKWTMASLGLVLTFGADVASGQPKEAPTYKPGLVKRAELPKDWQKAASGQAKLDAAMQAKLKKGADLGKALRAAVPQSVLKSAGVDDAGLHKGFVDALAEKDPKKRVAALQAIAKQQQAKLGGLKALVPADFHGKLAALADRAGLDATSGAVAEKDGDPPPQPQPQGVAGRATFTAPFAVITPGDTQCYETRCYVSSSFTSSGDDHDTNGYVQAVTIAPGMGAFTVYARLPRASISVVAEASLSYSNASGNLVLRVSDGQKELCSQTVQLARLQVVAGHFNDYVERALTLSCAGRRENATGGILTIQVELNTWAGGYLGWAGAQVGIDPPELDVFVAP